MLVKERPINLLGYINKKTIKGEKLGYRTGILYLAPAELAIQAGSNATACPFASDECKALCLFTAGFGVYNRIKVARMRKTDYVMGGRLWNEMPNSEAIETLKKNLKSLTNRCKKDKMMPCVRLNGTSDYPVHTWGLMKLFPNIMFYDYTKDFNRMADWINHLLPLNYHLTFSFSGHNWLQCELVLRHGGNVAIVFAKKIPKKYKGYTVVDGDKSDLRFLDRKNVIVGLLPKGKAKRNLDSKFIIKEHL
jgi:hypothetical protein